MLTTAINAQYWWMVSGAPPLSAIPPLAAGCTQVSPHSVTDPAGAAGSSMGRWTLRVQLVSVHLFYHRRMEENHTFAFSWCFLFWSRKSPSELLLLLKTDFWLLCVSFSYFAPQKFVSGFLFLFIHLFIFCKPREQNIKRLLG